MTIPEFLIYVQTETVRNLTLCVIRIIDIYYNEIFDRLFKIQLAFAQV